MPPLQHQQPMTGLLSEIYHKVQSRWQIQSPDFHTITLSKPASLKHLDVESKVLFGIFPNRRDQAPRLGQHLIAVVVE